LPKLGQDHGTFTAAMWQLQLWAGLVLNSFTFYFNFAFSIYHFHRAGQSLNIPTSFGCLFLFLTYDYYYYTGGMQGGKINLNNVNNFESNKAG
jgi:hypothetical protein